MASRSSPLALRKALTGAHDLPAVREAIARVPEAVLVTDRHGRYVAVNAAACDLTGYSESELISKALPDLTASSDSPVSDVLWRAFLDQKHQTGQYRIRRKDGVTVLVAYEAVTNVIPGYHVSVLRASRGAPTIS